MKLTVTGRYVDLDFGTVTPVILSQQFATESIAQSAASAIAVQANIEEYTVYSAKDQSTKIIRKPPQETKRKMKRKSRRRSK